MHEALNQSEVEISNFIVKKYLSLKAAHNYYHLSGPYFTPKSFLLSYVRLELNLKTVMDEYVRIEFSYASDITDSQNLQGVPCIMC